jgi:hypothetical protein
MRKPAALVGFLATCVALITGVAGFVTIITAHPDTSIETDEHLRIAKVEEEEFEFQLPLTLINKGGKPDKINRPRVVFKSVLPILTYSNDIVFADGQGHEAIFPLNLVKDQQVQLVCLIKWKPSGDYDRFVSEAPEGSSETKPAVIGRIELTWPGESQRRIERPFALPAAGIIKQMKPGQTRHSDYLYDTDYVAGPGDRGVRSELSATSAPDRDTWLIAMFAAQNGRPPLAFIEPGISLGQQPKTHYAVQGEIASGKEVASRNPNEAIVNIRPCGGGDDLVIFRSPFRKRVMGSLPCGVTMVQVEKL